MHIQMIALGPRRARLLRARHIYDSKPETTETTPCVNTAFLPRDSLYTTCAALELRPCPGHPSLGYPPIQQVLVVRSVTSVTPVFATTARDAR